MVIDDRSRLILFAWDRGGLGDERRMTYCAAKTASGVDALPQGQILVTAMAPCIGLMDAGGKPIWTVASPFLDLSGQADFLRVSRDGQVVDFGSAGSVLRFDVRSLTLSSPPSNDGLTFAPLREGLKIDDWRGQPNPKLRRPRSPTRTRARAKPCDRSGRKALLPRLELGPQGVRRRGNARYGGTLVRVRFGR